MGRLTTHVLDTARGCPGARARQFEWVIKTGREDSSKASRVVRSPQWDTSTTMPASFMAVTMDAPKSLMPPSTRSVDPFPMRFRLLYVNWDTR